MYSLCAVQISPPVVLTVQFDPTTYSITEGEQASIVAVLSTEADRAVSVDFNTVDGTALGM